MDEIIGAIFEIIVELGMDALMTNTPKNKFLRKLLKVVLIILVVAMTIVFVCSVMMLVNNVKSIFIWFISIVLGIISVMFAYMCIKRYKVVNEISIKIETEENTLNLSNYSKNISYLNSSSNENKASSELKQDEICLNGKRVKKHECKL